MATGVPTLADVRIEPTLEQLTRWEDSSPAYRVDFWHHQGPRAEDAWEVEPLLVSGADADEVMAWANERAERTGENAVVYAVHHNERGLGLIRLAGREPLDRRERGQTPHS